MFTLDTCKILHGFVFYLRKSKYNVILHNTSQKLLCYQNNNVSIFLWNRNVIGTQFSLLVALELTILTTHGARMEISSKRQNVSVRLIMAVKSLGNWLFAQQLFQTNSKKNKNKNSTSSALCMGNPPVTGGFPSQKVTSAESIAMPCCHHAGKLCQLLPQCRVSLTDARHGWHSPWTNQRMPTRWKKESLNKPLCNRTVLPHQSGHFSSARGVAIRSLRSSHQPWL